MPTHEEEFDELVRDLTSVVPRPTSEVRARIQSLLDRQRRELLQKIRLETSKLPKKLDTPWGKVDATANQNFNEGYNQAVSDLEELKKSL
jgi:hypothetical protein